MASIFQLVLTSLKKLRMKLYSYLMTFFLILSHSIPIYRQYLYFLKARVSK